MAILDASLNRRKAKVVLALGFGGVLILMGVLGLSAMTFLYRVQVRQQQMRRDYVERDRILDRLHTQIYLGGTYIRDFLLDADDAAAALHRMQFVETRAAGEREIENSRKLLTGEDRQQFEQLRADLRGYFAMLAAPLNWTPAERRRRGYGFIEDDVLPRRMNAIGVADRLQRLSETQLDASAEAVSRMFASFRVEFVALLAVTAAIGLAVAGVSMWRLLELEAVSAVAFRDVFDARAELKALSAKLVSAQEEERRRISRELHDEVGQVLSAMMLGMGNLRSSLRQSDVAEAMRQAQLVEEMTQRNAKAVRDLSLVLRPTMLDDLGLAPALGWLAREVSRNSAVQVELNAGELPDDSPEDLRTCVYRVTQEALRNACRHAGATRAVVRVEKTTGVLRVSVADDGGGFDAARETGMGILGMEERVVQLGGALRVESALGRGTTVSFELPWDTRAAMETKT